MSRAQGQFTIIDYNDALTLTGYIGSNHPKTQMYNPDNASYTPNWASTNLVLTPSLYVIGTTTDQITLNRRSRPFIASDIKPRRIQKTVNTIGPMTNTFQFSSRYFENFPGTGCDFLGFLFTV